MNFICIIPKCNGHILYAGLPEMRIKIEKQTLTKKLWWQLFLIGFRDSQKLEDLIKKEMSTDCRMTKFSS